MCWLAIPNSKLNMEEYEVLIMQEIVENEVFFPQGFETVTSKPWVVPKYTDWGQPIKICPICCEAFSTTWLTGLKCGHSFCVKCWKRYLTEKIVDEAADQLIACAATSCDILMSFVSIKLLTGDDARMMESYQHRIVSRIVEGNPLLRWCPAPSCKLVIMAKSEDQRMVSCICGKVFCFHCSEDEYDQMKRCQDNRKSELWIKHNTKNCPRCSVPIAKYGGGCDVMKCTRCCLEFCWLCAEVWCDSHCPALIEKSKIDAPLSREDQLNAVFEGLQQQENVSSIELSCIKRAVEVWKQCQQTISNIAAFTEHLRANNQTRILVHNLENLETVSAKLFECLTEEIQLETLNTWKENIQDQLLYCEKCLKVLQDHESEGYEMGWWDYRG